MVIEATIEIKRQIILQITDDDVDEFLEDLRFLFKDKEGHPVNLLSLHKIYLQVKRNE